MTFFEYRRSVSPLRYIGDKSKHAIHLASKLPISSKLVSPFVGGGSVEIAYAVQNPDAVIHLNDLNPNVSVFWQSILNPSLFFSSLVQIRHAYNELTQGKPDKEIGKEWRKRREASLAKTFILSRLSCSGNLHSGGFSSEGGRFTIDSIEKLIDFAEWIQNRPNQFIVSCEDFADVIRDSTDCVLFLDPPYPSSRDKRRYKGHKEFNIRDLAGCLSTFDGDWVMTLDDTPEHRQLFSEASIESLNVVYGSSNVDRKRCTRKQKLLISNAGTLCQVS